MAFRYFRLSQTSLDLYEAFRNMYLCFELLLSSKLPHQPGERERDWLTNGLLSADADLDLVRFFKTPPSDVVGEVISTVYTAARLPLFHAKAGKHVISPQGSEADHTKVLHALKLLTNIVLAMSETWLGARRPGGGVFHGWVYNNLRAMYNDAQILAMRTVDPLDPAQSDLAAERYSCAVPFKTEVCNHPADSRVPVLWGEVAVTSLWKGALQRLEVVGPDKPILAHTLESPLSLDGFDRLQYCDTAAIENRNQPKYRFDQ